MPTAMKPRNSNRMNKGECGGDNRLNKPESENFVNDGKGVHEETLRPMLWEISLVNHFIELTTT